VQNPLSWNYLTNVPARDQIFGPLAIIYLAIFVLGLLVTVIVNNQTRRIFPTNRLHRETLHTITYRAMWGWATGLIFFGCRLLGLNFLGWRLWEYACLVAVLGVVAYTVWWLRVKYPTRVAKFHKEQRRKAYLRPGSAAALALSHTTRGDVTAKADRQKRLDRADPANRPAARRPSPKASAKK
jgi:small-conductance mechanosensitive channel